METIFHIPHSSTYIPEEYLSEYSLSIEELKQEANLMCDNRTNEMIEGLIFPYSRLFCDVERFDSDKEIMNSVGMGVLYTKTHDSKTLRESPSKNIMNFYYQHHNKFNEFVAEKLKHNDEILIVDLHSYSKEALSYELFKIKQRPEICIGLNERFNKLLLEKLIYKIKDFNYTYAINEPFIGSLLPSNYINDERVHGIMIEIRKDVYDTSEKFEKIKDFLKWLKEL